MIREVVSRHPAVAASRAELRALEKDSSAAFAGFFPEILLDGNAKRERTQDASLSGRNVLTSREGSITLRQPLFDGFATSGRVATADAAVAAAGHQVAARVNAAALETAEHYIEFLRASALWELARSYLGQIENEVRRLEIRAEADPGLRSSVLVGRNQVIEARLRLEEARAARDLAEGRYVALVGRAPSDLAVPDETALGLPSDREEALALARGAHPLVAASSSRIDEEKGRVREQRAEFFPEVNLDLKVRRGQDIDGTRGPDDDESIGVFLTYRFSTGGAAIHRFGASKRRVGAAMEQKRETHRVVDEEVLRAFELYRREVEASGISARLLANSRELIDVFRGQFEAGRRDIIDFLFVLKETNAVAQAEIGTRFGRLAAAYRLSAATGQLGNGL